MESQLTVPTGPNPPIAQIPQKTSRAAGTQKEKSLISKANASVAAQNKEFQKVNCNSAACEDFIESYTKYADVLEAPAEMHEGVALSVVAAILNHNGVTIPNGSTSYTCDFWFVLLSGSGGGRNSMVRIPGKILERAGLGFLLRREAWGSVQAMYQHFAGNPQGLHVWGEMSEKLKELGDTRFGNAKAWLTDRYDETRPPENRTYRKTGREDQDGNSLDTPDIEFKSAPRTNFLATSSDSWFFQYLNKTDSSGGFIPRWVIQKSKDTGKLVPTPKPFDEERVGPLAARLREIALLHGEADLSAILPLYHTWYTETHARFKAQSNTELAPAFWNRHRVQVLKLAVIYQASRSASLKVEAPAWERAVSKARELEQTIFEFLDTDMSQEGYKLKQMEDRVRDSGKSGLPKHEFTTAFKTDQYRENKLRTLLEAQRLTLFKKPSNGGRPGQVLVHCDFVEAYTADYRAANNGKSPDYAH